MIFFFLNKRKQPDDLTQLENRELGYELYSSYSDHQLNKFKFSSWFKRFFQPNPCTLLISILVH